MGDGARYNPVANTWSAMTTSNAPADRYAHTAVWTGSEMIVWGGLDDTLTRVNTGGRYNPASDTWTTTSTGTGVPSARQAPCIVWTGSQVIIWGGHDGSNYLATGSRYNYAANTWSPMSGSLDPSPRTSLSATWTGEELIIWGGLRQRRVSGHRRPLQPAHRFLGDHAGVWRTGCAWQPFRPMDRRRDAGVRWHLGPGIRGQIQPSFEHVVAHH
jgi:hypothetical protein